MESGEDTGVSKRNSRLLMSSFSKRKVRRGPGLRGPMQFCRHPCTILYLWLGSGSQGRSSGYCLPLTHTGQCLRFRHRESRESPRARAPPIPLWANWVGAQEPGQIAPTLHLLAFYMS